MTDSDFTLEEILKKNHGLIDIKIKCSIRDSECLSMVYTPGVATPCLEIQKDLSRGYEFTNKANSIIVVTDSSKFFKQGEKVSHLLTKDVEKPYDNNGSMVYLEAFSAIYKLTTNIDAYPIILDMNLIPDSLELLDTINKISTSYAGIELFGVDPEKMTKFLDLAQRENRVKEYAYLDSNVKIELDKILDGKKTLLTSNSVFSAIWRVILDTYVFGDCTEIVNEVIKQIKEDKINLNENDLFNHDLFKIVNCAADYIFTNKLFNPDLEKYCWNHNKLTKEYVIKKLKAYLTYGTKAWIEPMPKGYYMKDHKNEENANVLHIRNRGVIEIGPKIDLKCPHSLKSLFKWEELDKIAEKILGDPNLVFEYTCKNNYGGIITNGTAVLGLGNIGALAGMPVMEGKSVLFKYFGGTNIAVLCIQELDDDKLILYCRRVAPSFTIINLEDIKGPNCFKIETELIKTVDCPMFHDDQHGTAAIVLAGLINAIKLKKAKPEDLKIVMNGAGAAGIAVCSLLMEYGFKHFVVCDTKGAIYKGRTENMNPFKEKIAEITNKEGIQGKLADVIKGADVLIGLSGPKTVEPEAVKSMNKDPIIFALANPIPEIYPDDAFKAGAFIVATGRSDFPNQINNSVVFPGIFRGTVDTKSSKITNDMKIAAAKAIANLISEKDLRTDYIMPSALNVNTSINVAVDVAKVAIEKGLNRKKDIDIDRLRENIHSFFIDGTLMDVTKE